MGTISAGGAANSSMTGTRRGATIKNDSQQAEISVLRAEGFQPVPDRSLKCFGCALEQGQEDRFFRVHPPVLHGLEIHAPGSSLTPKPTLTSHGGGRKSPVTLLRGKPRTCCSLRISL